MSDVIVAPETRDLASLADQLTGWLRDKMPEARGLALRNLAYPSGAGLSHETILFDATWRQDGENHKQGYVVRIKPTWHTVYPDDLFEPQYRIMKVLHEDGRVRMARPFWFEEAPALLGAPFFIMEKKIGRVPVSMPNYAETGWVSEATPAQRAKLNENGVRQLAAIQSLSRAKLDFLKGATPGAEQGLEQEWDKFVRFAAWVQRDRRRPSLERAMEQLRSTWPANRPAGVVWGDARLGNMMFDDAFEVVAVMDWEQPSLGGALHDLAWWITMAEMRHGASRGRPHLDGMLTRDETVTLWREITGVSTEDLEWYEAFTMFKVSCLSIRTAELKGQPAPDEAWLAQRMGVG